MLIQVLIFRYLFAICIYTVSRKVAALYGNEIASFKQNWNKIASSIATELGAYFVCSLDNTAQL